MIASLALIFGFLIGGSPPSAFEPLHEAPVVAPEYHAPIYDQATEYTATKGGPPARTDHTALHVVDYKSDGTLVPQEVAAGRNYTTYHEAASLARIVNSTRATKGPAPAIDGHLKSAQLTGVAAKSVDEVAQVGDTVLYQKLGSAGEHLKYGISKNPATRYTSKELDGGRLNILARGPKQDMLALERSLHETLPIGPQEGQLFYIQKQIANGFRPPPYPW